MELFELAEDGELRRGAERAFEIGQSGDFMAEQELLERGSRESNGTHNVIIAILDGNWIAITTLWRMRERPNEEAICTGVDWSSPGN